MSAVNPTEHEHHLPARDDGTAESTRQTAQLIAEAEAYIQQHQAEFANTHSIGEYFTILLAKGVDARKAGNYGIAAGILVRHGGQEMLFLGQNSLFTEGNPAGHAEMNATAARIAFRTASKTGDVATIKNLVNTGLIHTFSSNGDGSDSIVRPAPHQDTEVILFTTLEPCPMCTEGAVLNAGIQQVVMASEDTLAGGLFTVDNLTPIWRDIAAGLDIKSVVTQTSQPEHDHSYMDPELKELLLRMFFENRQHLDEILLTLMGESDEPARAMAMQLIELLAADQKTDQPNQA